jgi:hypothetical protein
MSEIDDTRDDERTLDALGTALPRVSPSPDLFDRVLVAIADEPAAAVVLDFRPRRRRWAPLLAAAAIGAVAAASVTVALESGGGGLGTPAATAAIAGHAAHVAGVVDLYKPETASGKIRVELTGVPAPQKNSHYEVWVLPRGSTQMTAVGSFTPAGGTVNLVLPLPVPGRYAAIDISVQPNNGPAAHSQVSLAGATF